MTGQVNDNDQIPQSQDRQLVSHKTNPLKCRISQSKSHTIEALNCNKETCYSSIMPNPKRYSTNAERQAAYRQRRDELTTTPNTGRSYNAAALAKMKRDAITQLNQLLQAREQYQSERSESWLDSDARDEFDAATEEIENARNTLQDC
jgi:hypothetical protein